MHKQKTRVEDIQGISLERGRPTSKSTIPSPGFKCAIRVAHGNPDARLPRTKRSKGRLQTLPALAEGLGASPELMGSDLFEGGGKFPKSTPEGLGVSCLNPSK